MEKSALPTYREEDFFLRMPEVQFDTSPILDYAMKNMSGFGYLGNSIARSDVRGATLPDEFIAKLNEKIRYTDRTRDGLDEYLGHAPEALFSHPSLFLLNSDETAGYVLHTDTMRPSAINFLIFGDSEDHTALFEWHDAVVPLKYVPNQATFFNTQIPHRVRVEKPQLRVLLTIRCSMAYQQFIAFYKKGFIEVWQ